MKSHSYDYPAGALRSHMVTFHFTLMAGFRRIGTFLLTASICGCATTSANLAKQEETTASIDPVAQRYVQAVSLQTTGADGQNSWIIEPDVPRTPKIAGANCELPPHIARQMDYAFDLAQRGATYSATLQFEAVLGLCALEIDSRDGGTSRRDALRQGWIALEEADQFGGDQVDWRESADVRGAALGHVTPVLNQSGQQTIDSIQAVQAYYAYAEQRLHYACAGLPGASMAFYGMGRTLTVPGGHVPRAAGKAALLYRVALAISPQNVLAANELGVLFVQHGQLDDAVKVFQYCVATKPSPEAYRNLAAVYARLGDQPSSEAALAAGQALPAEDRDVARSIVPPTPLGKTTNDFGEIQPSADNMRYLAKLPPALQFPKIFRH